MIYESGKWEPTKIISFQISLDFVSLETLQMSQNWKVCLKTRYNFVHSEVNRLFWDTLAHFLLLLQGLNQVYFTCYKGKTAANQPLWELKNLSFALEKSSTSDSRWFSITVFSFLKFLEWLLQRASTPEEYCDLVTVTHVLTEETGSFHTFPPSLVLKAFLLCRWLPFPALKQGKL